MSFYVEECSDDDEYPVSVVNIRSAAFLASMVVDGVPAKSAGHRKADFTFQPVLDQDKSAITKYPSF